METSVACGRCAHPFTLREPPGVRPVVCPQCGSARYYRLGDLAAAPSAADGSAEPVTSDAAPTPRDVVAPAHPNSMPKADLGPQPAARATRAAAASTSDDAARRASRGGARARIALILLAATLGCGAWMAYASWSASDSPDNASRAVQPAAVTTTEVEPPPVARPPKVETPRPGAAHSLEEAKEAIVKFEMPVGIGDLTHYGTGFLIDHQGWVATNHHVLARMTKQARVKLASGDQLEVEGILARAPEHDLAIVKLKEPVPELRVLAIDYDGNVPLAEEVFAFGHPYDAEFSLSKGIVSRVLTTAELTNGLRQHLLSRMRAPDAMVWIQHDAKISPGNSGGPLIDETGRVFGINTFVHTKAEFGYASHVQYLRELTASVSDSIEPLPDARQMLRAAVSTQRMQRLFDAVSEFSWLPETPEQYAQVADLAKQMTLARHALAARNGAQLRSEVVRRVAATADQRFAALQSVAWNGQHLTALNAFADDQLEQSGEGVLLFCSVVGNLQDQNALLVKLLGSDRTVVLSVGPRLSSAPRNSRWLVVGFVLPQLVKIQNREKTLDQSSHLVLTHYMALVKPSEDPPQ